MGKSCRPPDFVDLFFVLLIKFISFTMPSIYLSYYSTKPTTADNKLPVRIFVIDYLNK
jgi:hypothetical protein